uniref:Uncharacterized protein n=1 Tax=viral metagenome TaxID=1070528 RepID=A0A6M3K2J5_9ZZZZ
MKSVQNITTDPIGFTVGDLIETDNENLRTMQGNLRTMQGKRYIVIGFYPCVAGNCGKGDDPCRYNRTCMIICEEGNPFNQERLCLGIKRLYWHKVKS